MMQEKNNDIWNYGTGKSEELLWDFCPSHYHVSLPVFLCSVLVATLANQPRVFLLFPILDLTQCPLSFLLGQRPDTLLLFLSSIL